MTNGQSKPLTAYYLEHQDLLMRDSVNVHSTLMTFFAGQHWRELWRRFTAASYAQPGAAVLRALDRDGDGEISIEEVT